MTTHELYLGGGRAANTPIMSQFPAPAFSNSDDTIKAMVLSEHKATMIAALTRTLDFGNKSPSGTATGIPNDPALADYLRNYTISASDVLDLVIIPANTLFLGVYANVETPKDSDIGVLTLTLSLDDGTTLGAAIDCTADFNKMVAPNGAWVSAGAVSLATASFSNVARMLQATVSTIGSDNEFGDLRISLSPIVIQLQEGQY